MGAIITKGNTPITTSFCKPFRINTGEKFTSILEIDTSNLVCGKYGINLTFCRANSMESFYMQNDLFIFNITENTNQKNIEWRNDLWGNVISNELTLILGKE